jgi:hypothetical protein
VDPGADRRPVALRPDLPEPLARLDHGLERRRGIGEHRHHAVAQALHHLAVVRLDRRLDCLAHVAQQLDRGIVARLQRPFREVDEVGEDDGLLDLSAATSLRLRDRLPDLERAEPRLAHEAGPLGGQRRQAAPRYLGLLLAAGGQRVAELAVARQQLADQLHQRDEARAAVHALRGGRQPFPDALRALFLGHRPGVCLNDPRTVADG